jgi:hypothetical protein
MELFHIDVLCLQDVRLFANEARRLKKHAAAMLGPGCLIKASILTPHPDPETLRQSNTVGWGATPYRQSPLGPPLRQLLDRRLGTWPRRWPDLCTWSTTHTTY